MTPGRVALSSSLGPALLWRLGVGGAALDGEADVAQAMTREGALVGVEARVVVAR